MGLVWVAFWDLVTWPVGYTAGVVACYLSPCCQKNLTVRKRIKFSHTAETELAFSWFVGRG